MSNYHIYTNRKRKQTPENNEKTRKKQRLDAPTPIAEKIYTLRHYVPKTGLLNEFKLDFGALSSVQSSLDSLYRTSRWGKEGDCAISKTELKHASSMHCSLLFGEILPAGVERLCDPDLLDIGCARRVLDMGSGLGKLAVQLFFSKPHIELVWGIEFSPSRYAMCYEVLRELCVSNPHRLTFKEMYGRSAGFQVTEHLPQQKQKQKRRLRFFCGDMLSSHFQKLALQQHFDVIICETEVPQTRFVTFLRCFKRLVDQPTTRSVLTYHDLDKVQHNNNNAADDEDVDIAFRYLKRCYPDQEQKRMIKTSWTTSGNSIGHVFHIWSSQR